MTSLVYEKGLWGGFKSLYFARLSVTNSGDPFDCNNCTVVLSCQLHASVLLQNPHTAPDPHPFGKTTVRYMTCIRLFFKSITKLDAGLPETFIQKKYWENVFVGVCLPACLFIHLFIYYLEVAL